VWIEKAQMFKSLLCFVLVIVGVLSSGCNSTMPERDIQKEVHPIPIALSELRLNTDYFSTVVPNTEWTAYHQRADWDQRLWLYATDFENIRFQEADAGWQIFQSIMQYADIVDADGEFNKLKSRSFHRDIGYDVVPWVETSEIPELNADDLHIRCEQYDSYSPTCAVFLRYGTVLIRLKAGVGNHEKDVSQEQFYELVVKIDQLAQLIWLAK